MTRLLTLFSALLLTPAASAVYTGFKYGAFWGVPSNVKKAGDFRDGFNLARSLNVGIPFNSARLFTCKMQGTTDTPTEAFDAAVETNTSLLLGFWTTPAKRGDPIKDIIDQELSALAKAFGKHGKKLSDLIIGLSVGSEDIYRFEDSPEEVGLSAKNISSAIGTVKDAMKDKRFTDYMQGKPIGHVDTAKHAVVEGADFYGMTAYPYWNKEPATKGNESFQSSLQNVTQRAGATPVWIAEMGWPYQGPQLGAAVANKESLRQYWTEVGCEVIGKYNTFWFELIKDSEAGQPDWGILDPETHKPRINLTCPRQAPSNGSTTARSSPVPHPTTISLLASSITPLTTSSKVAEDLTYANTSTKTSPSTVRVTTTVVVTVQPSGTTPSLKASSFGSFSNSSAPACSKKTSAPSPSNLPSETPWCVTVADVAWDGQYRPVATNPAGPDGRCSPPPTYTGLPYGSNTGTASPLATSPVALLSSSNVVSSANPPTSTPQAPALSSIVPTSSTPAPPVVSSSPAPSVSASNPAPKPSGSLRHPHCKRKRSPFGGLACASASDSSLATGTLATRGTRWAGAGITSRLA